MRVVTRSCAAQIWPEQPVLTHVVAGLQTPCPFSSTHVVLGPQSIAAQGLTFGTQRAPPAGVASQCVLAVHRTVMHGSLATQTPTPWSSRQTMPGWQSTRLQGGS